MHNPEDFEALEPFFDIIRQGVDGLVDGDDYFDLLAGVVVLEYGSEGHVVATGAPYANRYVSVLTIVDRKIIHWRDYLDPLAVFDATGWPARH
jgi:ketosteroid isomerase-like protein